MCICFEERVASILLSGEAKYRTFNTILKENHKEVYFVKCINTAKLLS